MRLIILVGLLIYIPVNELFSQTFLKSQHWSFTGGFGVGKIQYFDSRSPKYIGTTDDAGVGYSPSWYLKAEGTWFLNKSLDLTLGLGHLTLTEKSDRTARPPRWRDTNGKIVQGMWHLIPGIELKFPDDRLRFRFAFRAGTANFIGSEARYDSNDLDFLRADLAGEFGGIMRISKRFMLEGIWIHGLTRYNYYVSEFDPEQVNFYKYHSFLAGVKYLMYVK